MRQQIYALRGVCFTYYATQAIMTPYLPIYFQMKGYSPAQVGLLMMIGPFAAMFAQPFWGYVSDRLQTTKNIIFLLWCLAIASSIGLFRIDGFYAAFVFAMLLYFFHQPSVPLIDSLSIRAALQRGVSYGSVRLWGSLGFTVCAAVSGDVIAAVGGIPHIPYLYWSLWVLPIGLLLLLKDEKTAGRPITLQSLHAIVKNKSFLWFLLLVFIVTVPHRMNDGLLGLYLHERGASSAMVGWAWALAALSEVPVFALLSRIMHRYHELALLGIAAVMYAVRWTLVALAGDPAWITASQLLQSVTFALFWMVAVQYAVRLVPEHLRSTGQSLLASVFLGLAGITGGTVGGWIEGKWGGPAMYGFGAALSLAAAVLFLLTHAYQRRINA